MSAIKIMVVEDERIVALHLRRQLLRLGYEVVSVASSGRQVLSQVEGLRPDVILMDIHIEGDLDGIETVARLPDHIHIPVIYLTAYSEEAVLIRARATKPFGYLLKPFSERELHATIQMAMERRAVEQALREREEHLSLALDAADMTAWEVNAETRQLVQSRGIDALFGCHNGSTTENWRRFLSRVPDDDKLTLKQAYQQLLAENIACQVEFRSVHADGRIHWLKAQGKSMAAVAERPRRIIGVLQDITEQRIAEEKQRQAVTVFEATNDGLLILDTNLCATAVNPGYCQITGYSEGEVLERQPNLFGTEVQSPEFLQNLTSALKNRGGWRGEICGRRKNGEDFPLLLNIAAVRGEQGAITHYVAACSDLTAIRRAEQELKRLAYYDPLTDLPNRLLAMDRLEHALDSRLRDHRPLGLLFIDLDFFKRINDTQGHSVGDQVLRVVALRMRSVIRSEDTVARLGGDEFMVIVEDVESPDDAAAIANKLIAAIAPPILANGRELTISASIGISLYPENGQNCESLIQAADTAMYAAKDTGRNGCAFYTSEMTQTVIHAMAHEHDLRLGLQQEELVLFYQPQIALETGAVVGVEALIRWQHRDKGLLGAGDVIPVAEKSSLIVDIGDWVVLNACRQAQEWRAAGLSPVRVAVNVSAPHMRNGRLLRAVGHALAATGLPAELLEIEITESMLQNEAECIQTLEKLRDMGVALAIDDFGTGYSCLSSLKNLPIQRLKIDQAFTRGIPHDGNDAAIAEAIIAMAHRLRLDVMAEGVETQAQQDFLTHHGCEGGQGFLYAKPMPAEAAADYIRGKGHRATG